MHYECYRYHLTRSRSSGKASGWAIKESPATLALMAQKEAYLNAADKNAAIGGYPVETFWALQLPSIHLPRLPG